MDSLAMVTLTIPIIYPLVLALGFDPIWFGVIIVLVTELGVITPPVGINVYVIKGITRGIPLETIFKGVLPFIILNPFRNDGQGIFISPALFFTLYII
jgi:TRAP-type C4-dicarboxylate transport system permease large subunit